MTKRKPKASAKKLHGETVLVLRTVDQDRKAYGGFQWPAKGYVEAPDWSPVAECGRGLHGVLKGVGDSSLLKWEGLWQVVEVEADRVVELGGKVKFPRCVVLYTGNRETACQMVADRYPNEGVIGATITAGDSGTATAGYAGTATAGNRGTATAGDSGTATAGYAGTATAGTLGTATAGDSGTATAGYAGTATAGYAGTATAGYAGTATAGKNGIIQISYYGIAEQRYRITTAYVGEEGIEEGKRYQLDKSGRFVEKIETDEQ